ncbi:hypothetical protein Tco_0763189 [Tanacetum coccineum]
MIISCALNNKSLSFLVLSNLNLTTTQATEPQKIKTANDEEVARKVQEEWDAEEERKRLEDLKKPKEVKKPKTISKKPTSLAQERTQMMNFLKGQGYKNLKKLMYPQMKELYDKVQESTKIPLSIVNSNGFRKVKADDYNKRMQRDS